MTLLLVSTGQLILILQVHHTLQKRKISQIKPIILILPKHTYFLSTPHNDYAHPKREPFSVDHL